MKAKTVRETCVTMVQVMMPQDANPAGNVHGGIIMKLIDTAAAVVAGRHARCNTVTASIDKLEFHNPVFIGDALFLKASLNMVGNTSMEIGVRAEAENYVTGEVRHTASAYLTFVALDENGKPTTVPGLIPESEDEMRRNREAIFRKKMRLEFKGRQEQCRNDGDCQP
jgi:uncharacterized protein (TIGR00369 family)